MALHRNQDEHGEAPLDAQRQRRIDELQREARATRDFLATNARRMNRQGRELKTNITDPDSAKMATSKGVIQGYAAQAAVDSRHQVIVAAEVTGSGSEQAMLLPMIDKTADKPVKLFRPADFTFHDDRTATCPAGKTLTGTGRTYEAQRGLRFERYEARAVDCGGCPLRDKCLRNPKATRGRQVARFAPLQRAASDPSQRIETVEPVFANIRHASLSAS